MYTGIFTTSFLNNFDISHLLLLKTDYLMSSFIISCCLEICSLIDFTFPVVPGDMNSQKKYLIYSLLIIYYTRIIKLNLLL
jgi:hypothetical protein